MLKFWMMLGLLVAPLAGCVKPTGNYCDIARPIYFSSQSTIDWLLKNDRDLVVGIVSNNDTHEALCN